MTGTKRGLESTPLVIDGVLYATGSWSRVYALDAASGRELWRFDPEVPGWKGRNVCCDVVNRGVAAWKGRIYLGTIDGRLIALDAADGQAGLGSPDHRPRAALLDHGCTPGRERSRHYRQRRRRPWRAQQWPLPRPQEVLAGRPRQLGTKSCWGAHSRLEEWRASPTT